MATHNEQIQDQFTKQALLFQQSHRAAEEAIKQALLISEVTRDDMVLDVACGPGILACAFARHASHVTGIDITPTMLEHARKLQEDSSIRNVSWHHGDVYRMPFSDSSFSMVVTRYSFHHLTHPQGVLKEMARVCKPGGRVVVIDSAPPSDKSGAFNAIERIRDPSHTKALTPEEMTEAMTAEELVVERRHLYAWEVTAESLLARSFPADGDRGKILQLYEADVGIDRLAMNARWLGEVLYVTFPTLITVGRKK